MANVNKLFTMFLVKTLDIVAKMIYIISAKVSTHPYRVLNLRKGLARHRKSKKRFLTCFRAGESEVK